MQTITVISFNEYISFITDNPTYQINDVNIISDVQIIITYTIPTI